MLKIQPLNIKTVVVSGIIELLEAFRINPTQAHQVLEEVKQHLPSPGEQDKDKTRCSGKEVMLTITFEPYKSIDVQSQVQTFVSPIIQTGDNES